MTDLIDEYKSVFDKDKYDVNTVREHEAQIGVRVDQFSYKWLYRCTIQEINGKEN